jgi:hypothetical protein
MHQGIGSWKVADALVKRLERQHLGRTVRAFDRYGKEAILALEERPGAAG